MICENCQHWFTEDPTQIEMPGRGICLKVSSVQSEDRRRTLSDENSQAHALTTVASTFGYKLAITQLETAPGFGCNQFEANR